MYNLIDKGDERVEPVTYSLNETVKQQIMDLSDGLKKKIQAYIDILLIKGHDIRKPYSDKIEGFTNLYELRPGFNNIEYRLIYFWSGNHAQFVNSFVEKNQKKKNRREYEKGNIIKNIMLERRKTT